jgi:hypothetical protein
MNQRVVTANQFLVASGKGNFLLPVAGGWLV